MRNYFIIERPVPPDLFFDRREEIKIFQRALESGRRGLLISIIAPFRFGKSSLIYKYLSLASPFKDIINIYLPLKAVTHPMETIKNALCEEIVEVRHIELNENLYSYFKQISSILEEKNRHLILYIDEFQLLPQRIRQEGFLSNWSDRDIFMFLRGITEEFKFGLIVSGSYIGELLDAIDVWNGRFRELKLGSFPREDSILMLDTLFKKSGLNVPSETLEYIAMSMGDHPYYMQLFGCYLVEERRVDEETIENVTRKVLAEISSLHLKKYRAIGGTNPKFLEILEKVAWGAEEYEKFTDKELELVRDLERIGVLYCKGLCVVYSDELFRRFILNIRSSRRPHEVYPRYTAEYLVARRLAYVEGFKSVLISYTSWGPFDIVLLDALVGIQVKQSTKDVLYLSHDELKKIVETAKQKNLLPILAVLYPHKERIMYFPMLPEKSKYDLKDGYESLRRCLSKSQEIKDKVRTESVNEGQIN